MSKRLLLLSGLAIFVVVINHAAGFGEIAMFLWTNRYRPVSAPNFDQVGSVAYYVYLILRQLGSFSVPAFLYISGFSIPYTMRTSVGEAKTWKVLGVKIKNLAIPYLIWSFIVFAANFLLDKTQSPLDFFLWIFTQGVAGPYYFIPLLCYLYLLSPFLYMLARKNWRLLLWITALFQIAPIVFEYLALFKVQIPGVDFLSNLVPDWFFIRWSFYFALGIACGLNLEPFRNFITKIKWPLLALTCLTFALNVFEAEAVYRYVNHTDPSMWYPYAGVERITFHLFAVSFILCYWGFAELKIPFERSLRNLGIKTYGIFLIHYIVILYASSIIYHVAPWILGQQVLFFPILVLAGLGIPLILMVVVSKSPIRKVSPILFS